jgi:hypothetical protein
MLCLIETIKISGGEKMERPFYLELDELMKSAAVPECPSEEKLDEGVVPLGQVKDEAAKKMLGLAENFANQSMEAHATGNEPLADEMMTKAEVCKNHFWLMAKGELGIFGAEGDSINLLEDWQIIAVKSSKPTITAVIIRGGRKPA